MPKRLRDNNTLFNTESVALKKVKEDDVLLNKQKCNKILSKRVIQQYQSTFKFLSDCCAENFPDSVDENGVLIIPIKLNHIAVMLQEGIAAADEPNGGGLLKASKKLSRYCSIIRHFYREKKVTISPDLLEYLKYLSANIKREMNFRLRVH